MRGKSLAAGAALLAALTHPANAAGDYSAAFFTSLTSANRIPGARCAV
jgi:hypothetical protein